MKIYKWDDYLKTARVDALVLLETEAICEIEKIESLPAGLVEINGKTASICSINSKHDFACIEYIEDMPKESKASYEAEITCPHCGTAEADSWEAGDSDDNRQCDTCGSIFSYKRDYEVTYCSTIIKRNDEVLKLTSA